MQDDEITPEYIVEQSAIISKDELLVLIENYGEQERDNAAYWATKTAK